VKRKKRKKKKKKTNEATWTLFILAIVFKTLEL